MKHTYGRMSRCYIPFKYNDEMIAEARALDHIASRHIELLFVTSAAEIKTNERTYNKHITRRLCATIRAPISYYTQCATSECFLADHIYIYRDRCIEFVYIIMHACLTACLSVLTILSHDIAIIHIDSVYTFISYTYALKKLAIA